VIPGRGLTRSRVTEPMGRGVGRMAHRKKRRPGGERKTTEKWERWQALASTARFVVDVWRLLRDHVISGGGPSHRAF
jgi:hypothetical protein